MARELSLPCVAIRNIPANAHITDMFRNFVVFYA